MKNILKILAVTALFLPFNAEAANVTVPSSPGNGYMLVSTTSGAYVSTTTTPLHVGSLFATSTTNTSTFAGNLTALGTIILNTFSGLIAGNNGTLYQAASSTLYGTGTGGQVLSWNNGVPQWVATSSIQNITLTTTGTSGASTLVGTTLNIPNYTTSGGGIGDPFTHPQAGTSATTSNMIFNSASSTFAGVLHLNQASTTNFEMRMYAGDFPGADIGAQINNAYAALPANGGIIYVPCASLSFSTKISLAVNNKPAAVIGCGADSTTLTWTGQATSTLINTGQSGDMDGGLRDLTLTGTSTTDIAPGIEYGGSNGYAYGLNSNLHITKFGKAISIANNSYIDTWDHVLIDFNVRAFGLEYSTNAGENLSFTNGSVVADGRYAGGGSTYQKCMDLEPNVNQGLPSMNFNNTSFDKCQVYVGPEVNAFFDNVHFEELGNSSGGYAHLIIAGDANTSASIVNSHFLGGNNSANTPQAFASTTGGNAYFTNVEISQYSGVTLAYLNANSSSGSVTYTNIHNVGGTGYTRVELPSGSAATSILHSWFSDGVLSLGTTTVADATSPLYVTGGTWDGSDYYDAFVGDHSSVPNGISFGYDNTHGWAAIHPTQPGLTALDLWIGTPYNLTTGLMLKQATGNFGVGTTTPSSKLTVSTVGATAAASPFATFTASSTIAGLSNALQSWSIGTNIAAGGRFEIASSSVIGTNTRLMIDGAGRIGVGSTTLTTSPGILNLGNNSGTANGSTTITTGKMQWDGYNSAGARSCVFLVGTTLTAIAGACN